MNSIYTILDFFSCSVMLGIAKRASFYLKWNKKFGMTLPKKLKKSFYQQIIFGFLGFAVIGLNAYQSGHLGYLDLAATVVSGFFCGYVLFFAFAKNIGYVGLSLLVPISLLLAVLCQSIFWVIVAGILMLIFFVLRKFLTYGLEIIVNDLRASDALLKDMIAQERKTDPSLLFSREEILAYVGDTLVENMPDFKIKNYGGVTEEMLWSDDLDLTEKDLYYLIKLLEYEFAIKFEDSEIVPDELKTIKDIVDLIEQKL